MYHITPLHCHQAEQQQAYTSVGRQTVIRHLKMSPVTSLIDSVSFHKHSCILKIMFGACRRAKATVSCMSLNKQQPVFR